MEMDHRINLLKRTLFFKGLAIEQLEEFANLTFEKRYSKGETIFHQGERGDYFHIVIEGLVKVSIYGFSGNKITYLLAGRGEPLNIVGVFTGEPRLISAVSFNNTNVLNSRRDDFLTFAYKYPIVINNIITILGNAIDSANDKIIDLIEKRVEQRLLKVLHTLQKKFGPQLKFTSTDFAELAGTTTESTLRAMARFREQGIIKSGRGEVTILELERAQDLGSETYWV
jgi:CRP-like cAMP-binding protein